MKKNYVVAVKSPSDWEIVHELLTQDGTLEDNIPSGACECTDEKLHSSTRSTYLLDEEEVQLLLNNSKISSVEIDGNFHYEERASIVKPGKTNLRETRYTPTTKHNRNGVSTVLGGILPGYPNQVTSDELNRTGYQILRLTQKNDPWAGLYNQPGKNYDDTTDYQSTAIFQQSITYTDDGEGVDVVITDDSCWLAHPEFVINGISQVKDLVLDGPYFLDPGAFSDAGQREFYLGRETCTESAALAWWSTPANRSAAFQNISPITLGPNYTRENVNGSESDIPRFSDLYGSHGTACASLAYGKDFGWAFNSNKWFICYGLDTQDTIFEENMWDIIKIFHEYKPNNLTHGDKNPLIVNTSWGHDRYFDFTESQKFVNYRGTTSTFSDFPSCPEAIRTINNGDLAGHKYAAQKDPDNSTSAANDLAYSDRVYIFNAAGNTNHIVSFSGSDDYNNYWNETNDVPSDVGKYFNRIGHPGNLGYDESSPNKYLAFSVGSMHHSVKDDSGVLKEQRLDTSTMGPGIDLYAPANRTLAANCNSNPSNYFPIPRYDAPGDLDYLNLTQGQVGSIYYLDTNLTGLPDGWYEHTDTNPPAGGTPFKVQFQVFSDQVVNFFVIEYGSGYTAGDERITAYGLYFLVEFLLDVYDVAFSGTSAACPVAAGFYACFLQRRRNWNALKLKKFIYNTLESQDPAKFYVGQESTSVNDSTFQDYSSLQGGVARIPYLLEAPLIQIISQPGSITEYDGYPVTLSVNAIQNEVTGTLSYQWEKSTDNGSTWVSLVGENSTSYTFTSSVNENGNKYRVLLSGTGGVDDTYSNVATFTFNPNNPDVASAKFYSKVTGSVAASIGTIISVFRSSNGNFDITQYPGYLECDGSEVNVSQYPGLYAVIGTHYGGTSTVSTAAPFTGWEGDNTLSMGTFKLPDFRGRKLVGVGGVDGAGSPSAIPSFDPQGNAGGSAETPGCTGGSWIMTETRQGAEYFVGNVTTSGYGLVTGTLQASLSGSTSYRMGPILDNVLRGAPVHRHILLTSDEDPNCIGDVGNGGDPAVVGDMSAPEHITEDLAFIYPFSPPDGSASHTHKICEYNLSSARLYDATYDSADRGASGSGDSYYVGTVGSTEVPSISPAVAKDFIDIDIDISDTGIFVSTADFELTASEPLEVIATIVPDGDVPLLTRYHRVKYLIKAY